MDIIYILKAAIVAIVEGLTEFIPVSSTGHMILTSSIINFHGSFVKMFEVVIQLGAILAVVVLYWNKIRDSLIDFFTYIFIAIKNLFRSLSGKPTERLRGQVGFKFGINVIIGSIPALIVGMLCYDTIKEKLFSAWAVIVGFLVGGILLIVIENIFRKQKHKIRDVDHISYLQSFKIGCFQCLSMWPGMSRSASTIMGGWISGLSTPVAAEYSFFLAIPAMVGSSFIDLLKFDYSLMDSTKITALIVGFVVAFIVALVVMKKFVDYLKKKPMRVFAVYRIGAAIVFTILMYMGCLSMQ
ncbi:undecaprenyl-diphosphate phosphatase [Clostridium sp. BJN0001]|uniref:undecaprenyl-diphosphate phosphatase n=1 Tax=Clostridium sp. BJN0001 TaxID=2930219 RepID=UPI001FD0E5D6|nr:undecaprenyl-diphosphate phosphatase [Clostridium sp. BJN0001]